MVTQWVQQLPTSGDHINPKAHWVNSHLCEWAKNHMSALGLLEPHWNSFERRQGDVHSLLPPPGAQFRGLCGSRHAGLCQSGPRHWMSILGGCWRAEKKCRDVALMSLSCRKGMTSCVLSAADSPACLCYILLHAFTRSSSITSPACRRSF